MLASSQADVRRTLCAVLCPLLLSACLSTRPAPAPAALRVAVCQLEVGPDSTANLDRIEATIGRAADEGCDLVCFPEASVFGWVNPVAWQEAGPIPGPAVERLGRAAARHGVWVVVGMAERDGDRLFNSVVLLGTDGRVLARHRKVNVLPELMSPPYTAGTGTDGSVVETPFGRIGLLICADTFRPELVDQVAAQRPDLVVVPYGWAAPVEAWPEHGGSLADRITATARRCRAPVVGVDSVGTLQAGPWQGYVLGGQSVVADADGHALATLPDRSASVRVVDVPLGAGVRR